MKKVLLLENIDKSAGLAFQNAGYQVEHVSHALSESNNEYLSDISILGIRSKTAITQKLLDKARRLEVIGAFCIGADHIDMTTCREKNITVFNAPFSNTRSVAELALGEMIMLSRRVFERNLEMHSGLWNKSAVGSYELRGKTLGIIGYGNIGTQVSVLAESFGMKVVFFDIFEKIWYGNAQKCKTLDELLAISDIITVHIDGRGTNKKFIGAQEFKKMKDGVLFLNLSRGAVVDLAALYKSLKKGKVGGAALDVFPIEPEKNGSAFVSELQNLPNVILTPHIAGSTMEAQANIGKYVSNKIISFLEKGDISLSL